jgi:hypothetical protein
VRIVNPPLENCDWSAVARPDGVTPLIGGADSVSLTVPPPPPPLLNCVIGLPDTTLAAVGDDV